MKITMLGIGAAYPGPGETCSGFLFQMGKTNLLIDCGNGVFSNLEKFIKPTEVTAIYISHMHADHFFDLVPFRYALYYGFENEMDNKPHLYLPPGGMEILDEVVASFAETDTFFADVFEVSEYEPGRSFSLQDFELTPVEVKHYVPSYGLSIKGERQVAYSSDSGECEGLIQLAKDADFYICNVGNSLSEGRAKGWGHLGPEEAGELAEKAGVKRMLVSHIRSGNGKDEYLKRITAHFNGTAELAQAGRSYEV